MLLSTCKLYTFLHANMVQTFTKRPISPLFFEPLYTPPEEILYPGSDEEATPKEREKKRSRVEIQGQQYLNGRPLFIQTARLRGPFEKGWVNPWRSKKRKYAVDDIRRFPEVEPQTFQGRPHAEVGPSTAKRRSITASSYEFCNYDSDDATTSIMEAPGQEKHTAKRRRRGDIDKQRSHDESHKEFDQESAAPNEDQHHWLKTDNAYPRVHMRDNMRSSTPTPTAKPLSKSHATSSPYPEDLGRAITLPPGPKQRKRSLANKEHVLIPGNTDQKKTPAASDEGHGETVELATTELNPLALDEVHDLPFDVTETSLFGTDTVTRYGYDQVRKLSQGAAAKWAKVEERRRQARNPSQAEVAQPIEKKHKKTASRLTPYVSEAFPGNDAASSAALRVAKAPQPKPSLNALPASTYQPEFQYRYCKKEKSTATSPQSARFVDAPEQPQARPRSDSSSSSGSSAFAEALEAAQEKATLKSFASSGSNSPPTADPETKSIKKNRQALRRLTFTPSGGAKIGSARPSLRPSSSSSAVDPGKIGIKDQDQPPSNGPPSLPRTSTKSSARSLTNGNRSRNSIILPEAQTDPIARPPLAQAPSGPSTNFLESEKLSPKASSFDEGDSYLDLSTQAAVWKAQRSFQNDVFSALTPSRTKKENSSPIGLTSRKAEITPMTHGQRDADLANAQLIKHSGSDDEEPMSTQAMVDAISPFAVTTVKKRPPAAHKRISDVPSPSKNPEKSPPRAKTRSPKSESPFTIAFHNHSPGMSTSPSLSPSPTPTSSPEKSPPPIPLSHPTTNSKPPSSLTSFSVLPNGTLTETSLYQQDGQQQEDDLPPDDDISDLPIDPFGGGFASATAAAGGDGQARGDEGWDLNAAIEEAGSFLGDWDVEAEARRDGVKRESGD